MCRRIRGVLIVAAAAMLLAIFCSCGKTGAAAPQSAEKLSELGNVLLDDLQRHILPNKQTPKKLLDYGYLLNLDNTTYGIDSLTEFYAEYKEGKDCEATMIFSGSSFVVVRLVFENGKGYHLRYEYDKFKPGDISMTGGLVDDMDLRYRESPPKWELELFSAKKHVAGFEFKDPA